MLEKAEDLNSRRFQLLEKCLTSLYNPYRPAFQKLRNPVHNSTQKTQEGQQNHGMVWGGYVFRGRRK